MKHRRLGRVIAVANQKGGVGKTTTAINLAASLAILEKRVLLLDLDPQGNVTSGLGVDKKQVGTTTYDVLGGVPLAQGVIATSFHKLFLLPTTMDLAGAEVEMAEAKRRHQVLARALSAYDGEPFDYVLIDCPPALGLLTLNALVAADEVLIPLQTEFYALEGLSQLIDTIRRVRKHIDPRLRIGGILLTMADRRNNLSRQVEEEARGYFGRQVFRQVVPRNVRLSEAPSFGKPALYHDVRSTGARAYLAVARELLARHAEVETCDG